MNESEHLAVRSSAAVFAALMVLVSASSSAQPARQGHPSFEGVWSGVFTTQKNEFWQLEDLVGCFPGCTPGSYKYFQSLLDDPANDKKPLGELTEAVHQFQRKELAEKSTPAGLKLQNKTTPANDPTILCQSYGLVREAVDPLPISVRSESANLVIVYEEWNERRTIHMNAGAPPASLKPTRLGYSVGHYEGDTLVVETTHISPDIYFTFQSGGGYSDKATVVERYTIRDNPRRLFLEMTVTDPVTLREPQVFVKTWLWTPDVKLVKDSCKDVPGKF